MTVKDIDPNLYGPICERGRPENCNDIKDQDFARAKAANVGIATNYKYYLEQGDCPCQASWAALYDAGLGRV